MKLKLQSLARLGAFLILGLLAACTAAQQPGTPTPAPPTVVPTPRAQRVDHFPTAAWPRGKAAEMRTPTPTPRPLNPTDNSRVWAFTCE